MTRLPDDLQERIAGAATGAIDFSSNKDTYGVVNAWAGLADQTDLRPVAEVMKGLGARLSMISACQPAAPEEEEAEEAADGAETSAEAKGPKLSFGGTALDGTSYEIAYHFDVGGDTFTAIVYLPQGGSVPSLTTLFRTADWHEREMMELFNITVSDHPDPKRLFLDPSIDGAVLERLIPFSTLVNSASTKGLWEQILGGKKGAA